MGTAPFFLGALSKWASAHLERARGHSTARQLGSRAASPPAAGRGLRGRSRALRPGTTRIPAGIGRPDRRGEPRTRGPRRGHQHRHRRASLPSGRVHGPWGRPRRANGRVRPSKRVPSRSGEVRGVGTGRQNLRCGDRRADLALARSGGRRSQSGTGAPARWSPGRVLECHGAPCGPRRRPAGTRRSSPALPTAYDKPVRSASRSSGRSTGNAPTPETSGWRPWPPAVGSTDWTQRSSTRSWRMLAQSSMPWAAASS